MYLYICTNMCANINLCIYICIYLLTPPYEPGYDTMSIFKWTLIGLKSGFSCSSTSCYPKVKEASLPY